MATSSDTLSAAVSRVAAATHKWNAARSAQLLSQARALVEHGAPPRLRDVLGIAHREVPLNRTLGWLLDPRSSHGAQGRVLASFATWLGADAVAADALAGEIVEFSCERTPAGWRDRRQPDLVVRGRKGALLVENKVWADEGPDQFTDYERAFRAWAPREARSLAVMARDVRVVPSPYVFRLHADVAHWANTATRDDSLPTWVRVALALLASDLRGADVVPVPLDEMRRLIVVAERDGLSPADATRLAVLLGKHAPVVPWRIE